MTYTHEGSKEEIKKILRETFDGDIELYERFHFINNDMESALADTFSKIEEVIDSYNALFFRLSEGDKTIGYINIAPSLKTLHSFGLHKDYRSEENKKAMMDIADRLIGGDVVACTLYTKNTRGIEFLKKMGFEEQDCITLIKRI
jgi:ribosomal protein S18 acetylase RimI-like enzyme